jgi:hypothetical protein
MNDFRRIEEVDFAVLGSMISTMTDFNRDKVKEYLNTPKNPVGDEAIDVAEYYLDLHDILDAL